MLIPPLYTNAQEAETTAYFAIEQVMIAVAAPGTIQAKHRLPL